MNPTSDRKRRDTIERMQTVREQRMETCKYRIVSGLMSVAKKHKEKLKRYTEIKMTFNLFLILTWYCWWKKSG